MDVVSRKDAQAKGLKKYFTGSPCRRGHVAERYVTGTCCACTSERKKELYQQNKEAVLAYMKVQGAAYRAANPDKRAENAKRWKQNNAVRVLELERKRRAANPEQSRARSRAHYYKHRNRELLRQKVWRMANKGIVNAFTAQRKTDLLQRTPRWLTEDDLWLVRQAYELAALRTKFFGFAWHVDHKLPLRGFSVSGLHVPTNLQVIPGVENLRKGNRIAGAF
jgi:hypothetical protein